MTRRLLLTLWLLGAPAVLAAPPRDFGYHLRYLSSDEFKGRENGSPESFAAAAYIAAQFRQAGLLPAGDSGTYFQDFAVTTAGALGRQNHLAVELEGRRIDLIEGEDFQLLSYGNTLSSERPLVFAGFGISAPELNYDDYQDLDVNGKVVLMFEHEPQERSSASPFMGTQLTPYSTVLYKLMNARYRGAAAVILLPDVFNHSYRHLRFGNSPPEAEDLGITAVRVTSEWAQRLLEESGENPAEIQASINRFLTPYSFELQTGRVSVTVDVVRERRQMRNVIGYLPGQVDEWLVLGAHYDHLGFGGKATLAASAEREIHNGADDNASGTAGLIVLAEHFARRSNRRGLIFIAFAGEELGLLGSAHYVSSPSIDLDRTVAMVNLDMIGRSEGDLLIGGVGTAKEFESILDQIQLTSALRFQYSQTAGGSSDHRSFLAKKIPVLFFFTGLHADYHRPSDDWDKIDVHKTLEVLQVVQETIEEIDRLESRPRAVTFRQPVVPGESAPGETGLRLGVVPDTQWHSRGIRLAQVTRGSPAEKAGLQKGDIIFWIQGLPVESAGELSLRLRALRSEEVIHLVVLREGTLMNLVLRV